MADRSFRYVMFPADLMRRKWYIRLRRQHPCILEWWFHLVLLAQESRSAGRILLGGSAAEAEDLALSFDNRATEDDVSAWEDFLTRLVGEGALTLGAEGGYQIPKTSEWFRSPSKLENRKDKPKPPKTTKKADFGKSREESGRVEPTRAPNHNPNHNLNPNPSSSPNPSAGGAEDEEDSQASPLPAPPPHQARPTPPLESLRPAVGQAMQQVGLFGSPTGRFWSQFAEWALPGLEAGALPQDLADTLAFAVAAEAHHRPKVPWPWMMALAAGELGNVARRNAARRKWEAGGRRGAEPLPYVFHPPAARGDPPAGPVTSPEAMVRGGGRI